MKYGEIVKGLPVSNESGAGVNCSHVLEYLSIEDFREALHNTDSKLSGGKVFCLVLHDLDYSIKNYIEYTSNNAALTFMRETSLGQEKRSRGLKGVVFSLLGNSQHLWMWDLKSMESELRSAGFVEIRRAYFGGSADPLFGEVKKKGGRENCLVLECLK